MSLTPCVPDEELAGARTWPADDPRRAHIAACARCRALVLEHEAFLREAGLSASIPQDARARLDASLERGLELAAAGSTAAESGASPPGAMGTLVPMPRPEARGPKRRRTVQWIALAAGFVVVAGTAVVLRNRPDAPPLERGDLRPAAVRLFEPHTADGRIDFRWRAWPGGDAYRLELLSPDFEIVYQRAIGADTTFQLRVLDEAPALAGSLLYWRVVADSAGVRVSESEPTAIRLP